MVYVGRFIAQDVQRRWWISEGEMVVRERKEKRRRGQKRRPREGLVTPDVMSTKDRSNSFPH